MINKCYVFNSYKQTIMVYLLYLDYKLQEDSYGSFIFELVSHDTITITYFQKSKQ